VLGVKTAAPAAAAMPLAEAREIAAAYGALRLADPVGFHDSAELPHPKDRIKRALSTVLSANPDPAARAALKEAFLDLARWQDGLGPGPHPWEIDAGDGVDSLALARRIAAAAVAFAPVQARSAAESEQLAAEWNALT
jgi:hypothetical protein